MKKETKKVVKQINRSKEKAQTKKPQLKGEK